jgi:uncharacterized membrane protein (DUF2068 family)
MAHPKVHPAAVPPHAERGLRLVAAFEVIKGVSVLLVVVALLAVLKHDLPSTVGRALAHLGVEPASALGRAALDGAYRLAAVPRGAVLGLALLYATARGVEGYGLWRGRAWAEWFGIASGALYLPFESAELARRPSVYLAAVLALNVLIVVYLAWHRWRALRVRSAPAYAAEGT